MRKLLNTLILFFICNSFAQTSTNIGNAVNTPTSVANPTVLIGANPIPSGTWKVYVKNDIIWETYNINGLEAYIYSKGDLRYKPITYTPNYAEITTALGYTPYDINNPAGYINTETDPVWTSVSGNYRTKAQNDLLYTSLTGNYSNPSWITSLDYSKLTGTPTIPAAQVNSDWDSVTGVSQILNKPTLSTVAISGSYNDLINKPTIPTDNNQLVNGSGYITASSTNTLTNKSGNISQWTNDSGYLTGITSAQINTALGYTPYNGTLNPNGFLTSFTEVDPTVPAYSKSLTAFSVIKTSTDALYEPIFSKNTAFNKNFGTTAGTITEGNDTRIVNAVQNTRTLTVNGTTFDLSANRTWTVGDVTTATLTSGLATKENTITAGTTSQYWRGDKSWQTLNTTAVPEGTNLYYTDARARASISLTTTGSGAATYSGGVLNIPTPVTNTYTAGTGISIASNIITNTAPNQTVSLTAGNRIAITGTYPNFTIAYIEPTTSVVTRTLNTNFTVSSTLSAFVSYTISCQVVNPLIAGSSTANAYLEYSTNGGSTWLMPAQNGNASAVGVAVAIQITNTQIVTLSAFVPANALVRIRTATTGTASVTYVTGNERF